ncbi:ATP-dependent metallopeptidase Hfl [Pleomassaria siparia CBS 279.74]|uniref:ATP-dependent metallopeptidase Hfl n=1 Tax=Pleomassaria siparia CBS 279.74 TaxID=1314801 RepID=A0A6G1K1G2_9PLEO|nr:ATP-dependent metallopeptidase Hfl [Pleomassaria siparia CBS 279.74]
MAFQTPVAIQNAVSATAKLWPTISTVLNSSWQGLGRQPPTKSLSYSPTRIPDILASTPVSTLRQTPSSGALESMPTVFGTLSAFPHNALRLCNPTARTTPPNTMARQYCTISRMGSLSNLRPIPRPGNLGLALAQQRTVFGGGPSRNTLARLEQSANNKPTSASTQQSFYSALLQANMPQIVVDRHSTGQFASNPSIEQYYQQALQKIGQSNNSGLQTGGQGNFSPQQMQAIGQAVGAHVGGGQVGKARAGSGVKTDPLYVVVEESTWSNIFKFIKFILIFGLTGYAAMVLITLLVETSGVLKKVGGGTTAEVRPEQQNARFADVQGCDEAKEELQDVVDFLKNPERYNKLGGRLPKGVLLIGPPGTGKTLLARAVAGEAGVPFFYMSGSEFDEVYVGVGAKRVRELFSTARSKAPAIVFIDELDALGGKRSSRDANYHRQTLNQLLNDLDGFDQSTGVIFIAATNHPEILDKALLRPGRFDRHVQVELPDVKGRLAILRHHTKKIRLSPEANLTTIARGTPGFSGAELENLANTAAIRASKHQNKFVSGLDLEWAKDKIMMGSERTSRVVPLADRLHTAYHEGGHALVGLYTKGMSDVHKATILPRGTAAGITFFLPNEERHQSKLQYMVQLQVSMGGKMAEEVIYGPDNVASGASGDITSATRTAYAMVTRFGFSDLLGNVDLGSNYNSVSPDTKRLIDNEVRRLIDEAKDSARTLLLKHRKELDLLAQALVQYETLDKEEILKVIKGEKLTDRLMVNPDSPIKIPQVPSPHAAIPPAPGNGGDSGPPPFPGVPV